MEHLLHAQSWGGGSTWWNWDKSRDLGPSASEGKGIAGDGGRLGTETSGISWAVFYLPRPDWDLTTHDFPLRWINILPKDPQMSQVPLSSPTSIGSPLRSVMISLGVAGACARRAWLGPWSALLQVEMKSCRCMWAPQPFTCILYPQLCVLETLIVEREIVCFVF